MLQAHIGAIILKNCQIIKLISINVSNMQYRSMKIIALNR